MVVDWRRDYINMTFLRKLTIWFSDLISSWFRAIAPRNAVQKFFLPNIHNCAGVSGPTETNFIADNEIPAN